MNKGYLVWIEYLEDRNYEFVCVYKVTEKNLYYI